MKKITLLVLLSTFVMSTSYSCKQEGSESSWIRRSTGYNQTTQYSDPNIINVSGYSCYKVDVNICKIEATIFKETNAYRQSKGKAALLPSLSVSYVARDWSQQQAEKRIVSHGGFDKERKKVFNSLKENGPILDAYKITDLDAENVASYPSRDEQDIGKELTTMWIHSSGHEKNIIDYYNYGHTYIGIGVVKGDDGRYYATQIFAK